MVRLLLAGALILATLIAYGPALRGGFVFDDELYVTNNPTLRSMGGLRSIWLEPAATTQYYPLVFTSYWIEYHLWGLNPLGYHLINVVLHTANALLLWAVLRRLRMRGALFAAAIFALHPLHVDSVAWVTERKDVLSAFFYLLSGLAWLDFAETRRWRTYGLSLLLFGCALLSKSVTCTLPLALLLVAWWKEGRGWQREIVPVLPFFALGAGLGLVTMWREQLFHTAATIAPPLLPLERALLAARALWFYVAQLLWPTDLMALYPRWSIDAHATSSYVFVLGAAAVLLLLWLIRERVGKGPLVAVLFFAITLAPASGLLTFDFQRLSYVADRFQYIAGIGLVALFAAASATFAQRHSRVARRGAAAVAVLVACGLGVLTWQHAGAYAQEEALWRDNVTKNPGAAEPRYNLGMALLRQGKLDEAVQQFAETLRIDPRLAAAHLNWGVVADRRGDVAEAMVHYRAALDADPTNAPAHNNLATVLFRLGNFEDAVAHFAAAVRIDPHYAEAQDNWGLALALQGKTDDAVQHYREALRIDPTSANAHKHLGTALAARGTMDEAVRHLREAVRLNPEDREARAQLEGVRHLGGLPPDNS